MFARLGIVALLLLLLGSTGCVDVEIEHTEAAIKAIEDAVSVANGLPPKVEASSHRIIEHLRGAGADLLANDVQTVMNRSLGRGGVTAKGVITMLDRHVQAYLEALKQALAEALPKIKAAGSKEKMVELLHNIHIDPPKFDPFVESTDATVIAYERIVGTNGAPKATNLKSATRIEMVGDALMDFPHDELRYYLVKIGAEPKQITAPGIWVDNTPFIAMLDIAAMNDTISEAIGATQGRWVFQIHYHDQLLVGLAVDVTDVPEPAPPAPTIKTITAQLYAIGDGGEGKDNKTLLVPEGYQLMEETLTVTEWTKNDPVSKTRAQNEKLWTYSVAVAPDRRSIVAECWAAGKPFLGPRRWIGIDVTFQCIKIGEEG